MALGDVADDVGYGGSFVVGAGRRDGRLVRIIESSID